MTACKIDDGDDDGGNLLMLFVARWREGRGRQRWRKRGKKPGLDLSPWLQVTQLRIDYCGLEERWCLKWVVSSLTGRNLIELTKWVWTIEFSGCPVGAG